MARALIANNRAPGLFSRTGQLFLGGPPAGLFQRAMPSSRLVSLILLLLAVSLVHTLWIHFLAASVMLVLAAWSGLSVPSILRIVLIPVLLFAAPAIVASALFDSSTLASRPLFFSRVFASSVISSTLLHSIGVRNISHALTSLRFPSELVLIWNILIAQVAAFSDKLSIMTMARHARQVRPLTAAAARRQVALQAGLLFATTSQRGHDVALAIQARNILEHPSPSHFKSRLSGIDYALLLISGGALLGVILQ